MYLTRLRQQVHFLLQQTLTASWLLETGCWQNSSREHEVPCTVALEGQRLKDKLVTLGKRGSGRRNCHFLLPWSLIRCRDSNVDLSFALCSLDEDQGNFQHLLPHLIQAELLICSCQVGKIVHSWGNWGTTRHSGGWLEESLDSQVPPNHSTISCAISPRWGGWQSEIGKTLAYSVNMQGEKNLIGICKKVPLLYFKVW